ncbi:DUF3368 domain-containing protein [Fibrobacter sp. UWEL]|uniref:DUF3368 domain-containing protein n=1 Tax=Fibrobacter sp. UWEL TaxID=1896209 RepID=UPI00091DB009|nr:DUF3368 domain-containing protein [Fibrobacter sp. UWEL]SHK96271.1 protein of unknown function [Fibrobacter sp. UWEL]
MRRVVINSTPLIILGNLNLLNVLHRLYGVVSVPQAVIREITAKKTAKFLGLTVTGTLGVLLKAKSNGIIGEVKPIMDEMNRLSFYVSEGVRNMVLTQAGELDK